MSTRDIGPGKLVNYNVSLYCELLQMILVRRQTDTGRDAR